MSNIKIAVAYHKPSLIISNDVYMPIQVGRAINPSVDLCIQGDDEGLNISVENRYYCELTATYWMWKNVSADYKGLCHYRRCFVSNSSILQHLIKCYGIIKGIYIPQIVYNDVNRFEEDVYKMSKTIKSLVEKFPIITTKKIISRNSCYNHFVVIGSDYISLMRMVVKDKYPDYSLCLEDILKKHTFHFANMTVMKSNYFDEYCSFLFGVLEEVKEILVSQGWLIDLNREKIFSRKLGYLAELLTNVYLQKKLIDGVKIKKLNVAYLYTK